MNDENEILKDLFDEDDDGFIDTPLLEDGFAEIATAKDSVIAIGDAPQAAAQIGTPGENVECVTCGKSVRVRKDGQLGSHKCEPKAQRGTRLENLPERKSPMRPRTRDFCVGVVSWCVEEGSARVLARPFDADPDDVPTDLPDADAMVGTPLDLLWPEIPKGAQSFIDKLADNADIIDSGIAWFEWMRTVSKWTRDQRALNRQLTQSTAPADGGILVPFQPFVADEG